MRLSNKAFEGQMCKQLRTVCFQEPENLESFM